MTRLAIQLKFHPAKMIQNNEIYKFFSENIAASYGREEAVAHILMAILLIGSLALFFLNAEVFHFTSTASSIGMVATIPGFILWWFIGHIHRPRWPRFGLVAATFANIGICTIIFLINWSAILSTPFPIIDYHLVQWDHFLGFDVTIFMAWAHQFPRLVKVFWFAYNTWEYQVILTPVLLALLKKTKEVNRYFIAAAICLVFCNTIYYLFPTIAPAGVLHSVYFVAQEYHLVTRFYEVHQHLPITHFDGGMVSFPSGHVMYALLVLAAWRKVKSIFYPLLGLNSVLIIATMAIGAHYLVDVIASFVIVTITLTAMHYFLDQRPASFVESKNPAEAELPVC